MNTLDDLKHYDLRDGFIKEHSRGQLLFHVDVEPLITELKAELAAENRENVDLHGSLSEEWQINSALLSRIALLESENERMKKGTK